MPGKLLKISVRPPPAMFWPIACHPIEKAGYAIVLTVHDEIISEAPDTPQFSTEGLSTLLSAKPDWAFDLPLSAAGFETYRYRKE